MALIVTELFAYEGRDFTSGARNELGPFGKDRESAGTETIGSASSN
jgi:hypothetical protein